MTEAGKNTMNQFNPFLGTSYQGNSAPRKKIFEPFRIKYESQKYHFVVDWQIDDEEEEVVEQKRDSNPYAWY